MSNLQAKSKNYQIKLAYVEGDDLLADIDNLLQENKLAHLDSDNQDVKVSKEATDFLKDETKDIVSANAYLGCRAISRALHEGADIVICGRVSDASPVMGAAQWWHGWADSSYDELAGALLAGHLIECSTYSTGGNFSGFERFDAAQLVNLACPIAEVAADGTCIITKHEALNGFVDRDIIRCQLLYELQGNIYLNSDVKADLRHVYVKDDGENRVQIGGVKG